MAVRTKLLRSDLLGSVGIGSYWYGENGGVQYQVQICPESPLPTDLHLTAPILLLLNEMDPIDDTLLASLNINNPRTAEQMGNDAWQASIDNAEKNCMLFLWGDIRGGGVCLLKKSDGYVYLYASYGKVHNEATNMYAYELEQINWIDNAHDYSSCFFGFHYTLTPATYNTQYKYDPVIDPDRGQMFACCWENAANKISFTYKNTSTAVLPIWTYTQGTYTDFSEVFNTAIAGYNLSLNPDGVTYFNYSPVMAKTFMCKTAGNGTSPIWEFPPAGWDHIEGSSIWGGDSVPDNPNNDGGGNGDSGGGGRYDDDNSDGNTPDDLPDFEVDGLDTGFINLYNPSKAQLQSLASFLFSGITENLSAALKRLVANPLDYIVGLNLYHGSVSSDSSEFVKFGGVNTNVSMPKISKQFHKLNGGTLTINEKEQTLSFLDWSPYCRASIYIPYCGQHELPIDLVMGSTMKLKYIVDLLTGSLTANLYVTRDRKSYINNAHLENAYEDQQTLTFTGNCFEPLPVASTDYRNVVNGALGLAGGMATSIATGNPMPLIASGANAAMNSKPLLQTGGNIGSCYGYMNSQDAFIIISRAIPNFDYSYSDFEGYPSNRYMSVKDFKGYLEVEKGTFWAGSMTNKFGMITVDEANELAELLENGVWVKNE